MLYSASKNESCVSVNLGGVQSGINYQPNSWTEWRR